MSGAPTLETPEASSSKNASAKQSVSVTSRPRPAATLDQMGSVKARMAVETKRTADLFRRAVYRSDTHEIVRR
jgi:hypothetical protein